MNYSKIDDIDRIGTRLVDGPNNTGTGDYDVIVECVMGVDELGQWTVISKPSCSLTSARNRLLRPERIANFKFWLKLIVCSIES